MGEPDPDLDRLGQATGRAGQLGRRDPVGPAGVRIRANRPSSSPR